MVQTAMLKMTMNVLHNRAFILYDKTLLAMSMILKNSSFVSKSSNYAVRKKKTYPRILIRIHNSNSFIHADYRNS